MKSSNSGSRSVGRGNKYLSQAPPKKSTKNWRLLKSKISQNFQNGFGFRLRLPAPASKMRESAAPVPIK